MKTKKIYVWGTGRACAGLLDEWDYFQQVEAFISNEENSHAFSYNGEKKEVIRPQELIGRQYDAVVVAARSVREIYGQSEKLGLDLSKFIFLYNNVELKDLNQNYESLGGVF